jgi:hypothetical protein
MLGGGFLMCTASSTHGKGERTRWFRFTTSDGITLSIHFLLACTEISTRYREGNF